MIFPLNRMVWGVFPTYLLSSFFRESVRDAHDKGIRVKQQNGGKVMSLLSFLVSVCLRQGFIT